MDKFQLGNVGKDQVIGLLLSLASNLCSLFLNFVNFFFEKDQVIGFSKGKN